MSYNRNCGQVGPGSGRKHRRPCWGAEDACGSCDNPRILMYIDDDPCWRAEVEAEAEVEQEAEYPYWWPWCWQWYQEA